MRKCNFSSAHPASLNKNKKLSVVSSFLPEVQRLGMYRLVSIKFHKSNIILQKLICSSTLVMLSACVIWTLTDIKVRWLFEYLTPHHRFPGWPHCLHTIGSSSQLCQYNWNIKNYLYLTFTCLRLLPTLVSHTHTQKKSNIFISNLRSVVWCKLLYTSQKYSYKLIIIKL